ncbi:hypothetical protein IH575_04560 [Candidatus Dojkabacteria bacterium]|nr:hypothetical protein [Candidatus Dojkabacteria bacterium]
MKVKITAIGKKDAFYEDRSNFIGLVGEFTESNTTKKGWKGGTFISDTPIMYIGIDVGTFALFHHVKVEPVEQVPDFLPTGASYIDDAEAERVVITDIASYDAFHPHKAKIISKSGWMRRTPSPVDGGWYCASFVSDIPATIDGETYNKFLFAGVKAELLSE